MPKCSTFAPPTPLASASRLSSPLAASAFAPQSNGQLQSAVDACLDPPSPFEAFDPSERGNFFTVKWAFCPDQVLPLWVADMDLPTAPSIQSAIAERAQHPTFGYTIQPTELWRRVARWWDQRHGWRGLEPEDFVFTSNLISSTVIGLRAFTQRGDVVVALLPLYHPLQEAVTGSGRKLVRVFLKLVRRASPEQRYDIDFDALRAAIADHQAKLLLWCSPHNPGGRVWTRGELRRVVDLAREHDVFIISDEIHSDLVLPPARNCDTSTGAGEGCACQHTPLALVAREDCGSYPRVMTMAGPGKTFNLAGIHSSYVIITDSDVRARYLQVAEPAFLHFGSTFATTALMAAYASPSEATPAHGTRGARAISAPGPWLDALLVHLRDNVDFVSDFVHRRLPLIHVMRPQASYLVWLDCSGLGLDGSCDGECGEGSRSPLDRFFVEEAKVMLSPGAQFGGAVTAQFMRVNVACPRAFLERAMTNIARAYEQRFGAK